MKPMTLLPDTVSLSDFKSNASKMLNEIRRSHRPVVITQSGKAAAVLISPSDFDFISEQVRFIDEVQRGLGDVQKGLIISDIDLGKEL